MLSGRRGWGSAVWALLLPVLVLGPALLPGYVLRADMVWVPDLLVGPQTWGLGSALPRAVPSDAVVGILDEVVPGALLQKLVLYGALALGALGARSLVPPTAAVGRWVAVTLWIWNPFVAERLLMGHWPVLVGLAVLPWLLRWGRTASGRGLLGRYALVVPLGCLSAGAGLVTAAVALAAGWPGRSWRVRAGLVAVVAAGNAPWVAAGLVHVTDATSAEAGAHVFATRAWGLLPAWLQVLDLGGVWNADAVLDSRTGPTSVLSVLVVVAAAVLGRRHLLEWWGRRTTTAVVALAVLGWAVAVTSALVPGAVGWLAGAVPGGGLLRDGSRFLALAAPLVVVAVAAGAQALVDRTDVRAARAGLAVAAVLVPLMLLPDLAGGAAGRLRAVDYPPEFAAAAAVLADQRRAGVEVDVLLMPFSSYRAPSWNGGGKVIDPSGRFTASEYVTNDALQVGGTEVPGEDPRAGLVEEALGAADPDERAARLRELGVSHVVRTRGPDVDRITGPRAAEVAGAVLLDEGTLQVVSLGQPVQKWRAVTAVGRAGVASAWGAYAACLAAGLVLSAANVRRNAQERSTS